MTKPQDIGIDALYSYRTYAGCYEGTLSHEEIVSIAKRKAKELWGERKTLVLDPNSYATEYTNLAWLDAPPMNSEYDGSQLVVIWFSNEKPVMSSEVILFDWDRYAEDYYI